MTYLLCNIVDVKGEVDHGGSVLFEGTAGHKEGGLMVHPLPGITSHLAHINLQPNMFTEEGWNLTSYVQEKLACGYHNDILFMIKC